MNSLYEWVIILTITTVVVSTSMPGRLPGGPVIQKIAMVSIVSNEAIRHQIKRGQNMKINREACTYWGFIGMGDDQADAFIEEMNKIKGAFIKYIESHRDPITKNDIPSVLEFVHQYFGISNKFHVAWLSKMILEAFEFMEVKETSDKMMGHIQDKLKEALTKAATQGEAADIPEGFVVMPGMRKAG